VDSDQPGLPNALGLTKLEILHIVLLGNMGLLVPYAIVDDLANRHACIGGRLRWLARVVVTTLGEKLSGQPKCVPKAVDPHERARNPDPRLIVGSYFLPRAMKPACLKWPLSSNDIQRGEPARNRSRIHNRAVLTG
jgi:hypothetical protein